MTRVPNEKRRGSRSPNSEIPTAPNEIAFSATPRHQQPLGAPMSNSGRARTRMRVQILDKGEPLGSPITVLGRDAWALRVLIEAGKRGFSSIDKPAPRTAHYIFKLRKFGFAIETITEMHGGAYPGHHARYVLHSNVAILEGQAA